MADVGLGDELRRHFRLFHGLHGVEQHPEGGWGRLVSNFSLIFLNLNDGADQSGYFKKLGKMFFL